MNEENRALIAAALSPFSGPWLAMKYEREQDELRVRAFERWQWERIARGPLDARSIARAVQKLNRVARPHRYTMWRKIQGMAEKRAY